MKISRLQSTLILCIAGVGFALGNLWFTAARSTIPIAIDAQLAEREISYEKLAGVDDVHWLVFEDGKRIHVDRPVYEAVRTNEHLLKSAWTKRLQSGQETVNLNWSPDFLGMLWVMPLSILLLIAISIRGSTFAE